MSPPRSGLRLALRLSPLRSHSRETRRSSPSVSLWALPAPAPRTDPDGLAVLRKGPSQGRGWMLGACVRRKRSEHPSASGSLALLLPTLLSLTPLQLQLNATVLKQAAFYRTANRAERAPLLPSSAHRRDRRSSALRVQGPPAPANSPLLSPNAGETPALLSP